MTHAERGGGARLVEEQHGADAASMPGRVHREGVDVTVFLTIISPLKPTTSGPMVATV